MVYSSDSDFATVPLRHRHRPLRQLHQRPLLLLSTPTPPHPTTNTPQQQRPLRPQSQRPFVNYRAVRISATTSNPSTHCTNAATMATKRCDGNTTISLPPKRNKSNSSRRNSRTATMTTTKMLVMTMLMIRMKQTTTMTTMLLFESPTRKRLVTSIILPMLLFHPSTGQKRNVAILKRACVHTAKISTPYRRKRCAAERLANWCSSTICGRRRNGTTCLRTKRAWRRKSTVCIRV